MGNDFPPEAAFTDKGDPLFMADGNLASAADAADYPELRLYIYGDDPYSGDVYDGRGRLARSTKPRGKGGLSFGRQGRGGAWVAAIFLLLLLFFFYAVIIWQLFKLVLGGVSAARRGEWKLALGYWIVPAMFAAIIVTAITAKVFFEDETIALLTKFVAIMEAAGY